VVAITVTDRQRLGGMSELLAKVYSNRQDPQMRRPERDPQTDVYDITTIVRLSNKASDILISIKIGSEKSDTIKKIETVGFLSLHDNCLLAGNCFRWF
jgi:hypothetical protein